VGTFPGASQEERPGIAWALSKSTKVRLEDLLGVLTSDEDSRHWIAYVVGTQQQERFIGEVDRLRQRDPEVYFAVTVLWKIMTSWIHGLEEFG
jgi:hypothetical protein